MTTATTQINIPLNYFYRNSRHHPSILNINLETMEINRVKKIAEAQRITRNNIDTSAIDALDHVVEKILLKLV
jgi:hypothetical protein